MAGVVGLVLQQTDPEKNPQMPPFVPPQCPAMMLLMESLVETPRAHLWNCVTGSGNPDVEGKIALHNKTTLLI